MTLHDPGAGAGAPELGHLRLVLQDPLWGTLRLWVRIDDRPVPTTPGENLLPLTPGPHTIEIDDVWRPRTSGAFEVAPGETSSLYFAPGFGRFEMGGLGPEPQRTRGVRVLTLIGVVMIVWMLVQLFN